MPRISFLTTRAHDVFALAHDIADRQGHDEPTLVHLALAVIRKMGVPAGALHNLGVQLDALDRELEERLPARGTARTPGASRYWTPWDKQMIDEARLEARELGTEFYGSEHLLLALLRDSERSPAQVFAKHGVHYSDLRGEVLRLYNARPDEPPAAQSPPAV